MATRLVLVDEDDEGFRQVLVDQFAFDGLLLQTENLEEVSGFLQLRLP